MASSITRRLAGPLLGGLLLVTAAGCGTATDTANAPTADGVTKPLARVPFPHAPTGSVPPAPSSAGTANCASDRCTVTLSTRHTRVDVLGTTVRVDDLGGNRAKLNVGNRAVNCIDGETVAALPFMVTCSTVNADRVTFTMFRPG